MNTLEEKLVKYAHMDVNTNTSIVDDVKLLLAANVQEERSVLASVGLDNNLRFVEKKQEDLIIRKEAQEFLGKPVVGIGEIRRLCLEYRLYMKPARDYIGHIPNELGADLARFCKEKNIVLPKSTDYSNFFIIAPPKMFEGYMNPMQVVTHSVKEVEKRNRERAEAARVEKERRRALLNQDPILVYRLTNSDNHYAIIKSWGNDFTPLRRVYAFFTRKTTMMWMNFLFMTAFLFLGISMVVSLFKFTDKALLTNPTLGILGIFGILGASVFIIVWSLAGSQLRREIIKTVTQHNEPTSVN